MGDRNLYFLTTLLLPVSAKTKEAFVFVKKVSANQLKELLSKNQFKIYNSIRHSTTLELIKQELGIDLSKVPFVQEVQMKQGDLAIAIKLRSRLSKGVKDISIEDLKKIGYDYYLIEITKLEEEQ